jgi:hypothetical protein
MFDPEEIFLANSAESHIAVMLPRTIFLGERKLVHGSRGILPGAV